MTTNSNYLLAGGIAEIVMYPSLSTLPEVLLTPTTDSYTVKLHSKGSSYTETRSCEDGVYSVLHRLCAVSYIGDEATDDRASELILRNGVVADIKFNSGAVIRVGWSEKHGTTAPLRLVSSELYSGEKRLDYPLKNWVWESTDHITLI